MILGDYIYAMNGYETINGYQINEYWERYKKGAKYWEIITFTCDLNFIFRKASTSPMIFENKKYGDQIIIYGGWKQQGFLREMHIIDREYFEKWVTVKAKDYEAIPELSPSNLVKDRELFLPKQDMITKKSIQIENRVFLLGNYSLYEINVTSEMILNFSIGFNIETFCKINPEYQRILSK